MEHLKRTRHTMTAIGLMPTSYTTEQVADMIDECGWADGFNYSQIKILARHTSAFTAEEDVSIVREGLRESFMGLILKGQVRIVKHDMKKNEIPVAKLGPGKTFGEMAMIDSEVRSASVVADKPTTVLIVTQDSFFTLADENPKFGMQLILRIAKVISQRLRQTSGRLIDHLET